MMAMVDFIITEMDFTLKSLKFVSDLNQKNFAGLKTEYSFYTKMLKFVFPNICQKKHKHKTDSNGVQSDLW